MNITIQQQRTNMYEELQPYVTSGTLTKEEVQDMIDDALPLPEEATPQPQPMLDQTVMDSNVITLKEHVAVDGPIVPEADEETRAYQTKIALMTAEQNERLLIKRSLDPSTKKLQKHLHSVRKSKLKITPISEERLARLSTEQAEAYDRVVNRHENVVILGAAGTGKSLLINEIRSCYDSLDIAVSATTGNAANLINGCTFHKLFGVGILKGDKHQIYSNLIHNSRNESIIGNLKRIRVCIIDEISMMSRHAFEVIDYVARQVREKDAPFGGIQMILVGDFYQIKPVSTKDDTNPFTKHYAFQSEQWFQYFPAVQHILLRRIYRQVGNPVFTNALKDISLGTYTGKVKSFIEQTIRPLVAVNGIEPTRFDSTRRDVRQINLDSLKLLNGSAVQFPSKDLINDPNAASVDSSDREVPAESLLQLKVGAQVVLIRNINVEQGLFNGARGVVQSMEPSCVQVYFMKAGTVAIKPAEFPQYGIGGCVVATRTQIPLKLAWALTIHSGQGMTLDYVILNLSNCWEPGQAYVGCSRVREIKHLQITGFTTACLKKSSDVEAFYEIIKQSRPKRTSDSFMTTTTNKKKKKKKLTHDVVVSQ
jgi:ATP-dependent DNA helicase PIF1